MKTMTDSKYQKHHGLAQEHRSEIPPLAQDSREAKEDSRHPEQLSCARALFLPMRWSDSNLDYDFNLK